MNSATETMLSLQIPNDLLLRAVSDACSRRLHELNAMTGYVDKKGACKFLSVSETQFKEWVKLGLIHPRKVSTHLVRFHLGELSDFMEQFKLQRSFRPKRVLQSASSPSERDEDDRLTPLSMNKTQPHSLHLPQAQKQQDHILRDEIHAREKIMAEQCLAKVNAPGAASSLRT